MSKLRLLLVLNYTDVYGGVDGGFGDEINYRWTADEEEMWK